METQFLFRPQFEFLLMIGGVALYDGDRIGGRPIHGLNIRLLHPDLDLHLIIRELRNGRDYSSLHQVSNPAREAHVICKVTDGWMVVAGPDPLRPSLQSGQGRL